MIIIPVHALWTLLGIWLAVVLCAFMFGWYAQTYARAESQAELERAVRRHPSTRYRPDHLPRPGRLPGLVLLQDNYPDEPAVGRWWPALERHARADTAPFAQVEASNWEARIKRDTDAWLHERGMQ